MKILSHINNKRFIVKHKNKYFLISTEKKQIFEVDDPNKIYRQGFWKEYNGTLSKENKNIIESLLNLSQ